MRPGMWGGMPGTEQMLNKEQPVGIAATSPLRSLRLAFLFWKMGCCADLREP